jgi:hypothetical protein
MIDTLLGFHIECDDDYYCVLFNSTVTQGVTDGQIVG